MTVTLTDELMSAIATRLESIDETQKQALEVLRTLANESRQQTAILDRNTHQLAQISERQTQLSDDNCELMELIRQQAETTQS